MRISELASRAEVRPFIPARAGLQRRLFLAGEARRSLRGSLAASLPMLFVAMLAVAAALPMLRGEDAAMRSSALTSVDWPATFEGRPLKSLPLSAVEQRFADRFPGQIGHFSDGQRDIIVRRIDEPTRLLHPAADCFRGLGYSVEPARVIERPDGTPWSCFAAERNGVRRSVCERVHDDDGNGWTDVSAWYWSALLGRGAGPWWAVTVASRQ